MPSLSRLHRAAKWFVEHGFPIFPCRPRDKRPATAHGHKDATTSLEQIDRWWRDNPSFNIGMPMGKASGLLLVDLDFRGESVVEDRSDLIRLYGPWSDTCEVITGSGGRHLYFRDPGLKTPRGLAQGIDLKASGGFAIVPPSIHSFIGRRVHV